ncbi:hypothetical protein M9435_002526 [Picochlorum sp. BPE23]|nr:hypothetical protein M9435_002526 [Picochlorum sp. BPE23]
MDQRRRAAVSLYRRVLRAHIRCLPEHMRQLGDRYFRDEFIKHVDSNVRDDQWEEFVKQWDAYCGVLLAQKQMQDPTSSHQSNDGNASPSALVFPDGASPSGELDQSSTEALSDDQKARLIRLEKEALSFGKSAFPSGPEHSK